MNEEKVFQPNLTTELIISSSQKFLSRNEISSYLELGCGCGEITFKNILNMNSKKVVITDIGSKAIEVASKRFARFPTPGLCDSRHWSLMTYMTRFPFASPPAKNFSASSAR